jgi:hypothetical protein
MNWLAKILLRIGLATSIIVLGVPAARAALPLLPVSSWPVEVTGQGILNVATPDTNSTYWVMAIDTSLWSSIVIHGTYPQARAFNFTSYDSKGSLIGTVSDSQIAPDSGSTNPFTAAMADRPNNYTVTVGTSGIGSSNVLDVGENRLVFIVHRVIVPNQGLDRSGGVGAPAVRFVARDGSVLQPPPCPFVNAESSFGIMIPVLIASGFSDAAGFLQNILTASQAAKVHSGQLRCCAIQRRHACTVRISSRSKLFPRPPSDIPPDVKRLLSIRGDNRCAE